MRRKKMRKPGPDGYQSFSHQGFRGQGRLALNKQFITCMPAKRSARAKASRRETIVRFGPAGWLYKDWEVIVYPREKSKGFDPLRYIADFFDTVEINSTFYGPPIPRTTTS